MMLNHWLPSGWARFLAENRLAYRHQEGAALAGWRASAAERFENSQPSPLYQGRLSHTPAFQTCLTEPIGGRT
ncbi:hypothetical protein KGO5_01736 [Sinorhizobium sp. KGO-5]|nr:hypothetical protein KGO5_01736 [Sinorhizobium sp. KGO-5]